MFCGNCGEKIPDKSIYCMFCGKPAKPAQPDPEEETLGAAGDEWEGRAIWEACHREQQRKNLGFDAENPQDPPQEKPQKEPQEKPEPLPEPAPEPPVPDDLPTEKEPTAQKFCKRCGKPLSENSISEYCLECLYSPDVLEPDDMGFDPLPAELDAPELDLPEAPIPPRKHRLLAIFVIAAAVLAVIASSILLLPKIKKNIGRQDVSSQSASQRQEEHNKDAVNFAHEMVKDAAYAPDSIHFETSTVNCSVEAGDYTVVEQFERQNAQGETITTTYTAILNLGGEKGYTPIFLQVDDAVLYDYR